MAEAGSTVERMELEEINDVEDKALRLRLLKEYIREKFESQSRQTDIDYSYDETSMRDHAGGMMSTVREKKDSAG